MSNNSYSNWTSIESRRHLLDINFKEIWRYRDLLYLFVKRDFIAVYKQTVLGPAWFLIQPIFTTLIFTFVFGRVGNLSPTGTPVFLYYLSGLILWQYFADCIKKTADTFIANQGIFGKVYFPRLIIPLSIILSALLKLGVQLFLFIGVLLFYMIFKDYTPEINSTIILFPVLVLLVAGLGMGLGLIISSLTTKYRDLKFLLEFGVQLLMYITPGIIMSYESFISTIPKYAFLAKYNPIGWIIESFKHATVNAGIFSVEGLTFSFVFMIIILFFGVIIFNKTEQNFMDTV
jgi:lipopolysaccharide transport system permease protein